MIIKKLPLFLILYVFIHVSKGQSLYSLESIENAFQVTSPSAWSFLKFTENPVDLYSGTAEIGLDLYTVKDGMAHIPLSLRYNSSGIKVDEVSDWVGLGWNLSAGGVITNIINGSEDNPNYSYNEAMSHFTASSGTEFWGVSNTNSNQVESFFRDAAYGNYNPDIYLFNFLGYSGKFYIDYRTNQLHFIDRNKNNLKFEVINNDYYSPNAWKVTLPDGTVAKFEEIETTISDRSISLYSSISFYLTEINYPDGSYVNFTYSRGSEVVKYTGTTEETYYIDPAQSTSIYLSETLGNYQDGAAYPIKLYHQDAYTPRVISQIETNNFLIDFTVSPRNDFNGLKKLDNILITDKNSSASRSFTFQYGYFIADPTIASTIEEYPNNSYSLDYTKRLKLLSVTDKEGNQHSFDYYENFQLPKIGSYARDFWGYYNGRNNSRLIPNLTHWSLSYLTQLMKFTAPTTGALPWMDWGGNRNASEQHMITGSLKTINYPTGGSRKFEYQANTFDNYSIPTADYQRYVVIPGQSGTLQDSNGYEGAESTSVYLPAGNQNASVDLTIDFNVGQICNTSQYQAIRNMHIDVLLNSSVTIRGGLYGTTIYKEYKIDPSSFNYNYSLFDSHNHFEISVPVDPSWVNPFVFVSMPTLTSTQKSVNCNLTGSYGFKVQVAYEVYSTQDNGMFQASAQNPSKGGGIRIASIIDLDENQGVVTKRIFEYQGGKLFSPISFLSNQNMKTVEAGPPSPNCSNPGLFPKGFGNVPLYTLSSNSDANIVNNSHYVGYDQVTEKTVNLTGVALGRIRHTFINNILPEYVPKVPYFLPFDNGLETKMEIFDIGGYPKLKKEYQYAVVKDYFTPDMYYAVTGVDNWIGPDNFLVSVTDCCALTRGSCEVGVTWDIYAYRIAAYFSSLKSERWDLTKETITNYDGGIQSSFVSDYTYNDIGQLISEETYSTARPTDKSSVTYTYPYDVYNSTMLNANVHYLLGQKRYRNANQIYSAVYNYGQQAFSENGISFSGFYPYEIIVEPTGNPTDFIQTDLVFEHGKMVQYTGSDGVIVSALWFDNKLIGVGRNVSHQSLISNYNICNGNWNCIRTNLSGAEIIDYEYDPLDGPVKMTDATGMTQQYIYDDLGRLFQIKDFQGYILKEYTYEYAGQ